MKNIALIFSPLKTTFFYFSIYKMVDSEYSMNTHKSVKISIGTVIKNPEMLEYVPDDLKTKKISKHEVKNLP